MFVLDEGNMEVVQLTNSGRFQRRFGQNGALADRLSSPQGLAAAPDGRIFVADPGHARIAVYSSNGAFQRVITTVANPNRISFVATQQFVVTQAQDVLRVNARTGAIDRTARVSTGTAEGVAYNPADRRVYVADFGGGVLKAFNTDLSTVVDINTTGIGRGPDQRSERRGGRLPRQRLPDRRRRPRRRGLHGGRRRCSSSATRRRSRPRAARRPGRPAASTRR